MIRPAFGAQHILLILAGWCLSGVAVAQTPDWETLLAAGGSYESEDGRETMQLREHSDSDIAAIAKTVTDGELPVAAEVVTSSQRGTGPAVVLATLYKIDDENRLLSVSVATRNGGGALSLAHSIDPALPNAAARLSNGGSSLLQAAMQGDNLSDIVSDGINDSISDSSSGRDALSEDRSTATPSAAAARSATTAKTRGVERVLFDLDYKYGVGGAAYPVYKPVVLFADGAACQCLESAIDDIDVDAVRRVTPKRVGTWQRQGADYEVRWTGVRKTETLKAGVGPPQALPGASNLRGQYQHISGGGNTALGGGVMSASIEDLRFFADGSFAQSNSRMMQSDAAVVSGKRGKSGLWSLNGSTLTLSYVDGTTVRTTVFYSAKRKSSATFGRYGVLWIGGEGFKRIE